MYSFKVIFIFILICLFKYDKFIYSKNFDLYLKCEECLMKKIINSGCSKCSIKSIFQSIKVMSIEETINEILYNKKSIIFLDSEMVNLI